MRLDNYLYQNNFFQSRKKASDAIKKGLVFVNGKKILKPAKEITEARKIKILEDEEFKYVSRGALKLKKALEYWKIKTDNKITMDIGASTGGFSEVLLEHGVKKIYAIDVGINQLSDKLKNNKKIINLEKTDIRNLNKNKINDKIDLIVCDLSFISIFKILDPIKKFCNEKTILIILFKPQFESQKKFLNKKGVLKNEELKKILEKAPEKIKEKGFNLINKIESPIKGGDGNTEFLFLLKLF